MTDEASMSVTPGGFSASGGRLVPRKQALALHPSAHYRDPS